MPVSDVVPVIGGQGETEVIPGLTDSPEGAARSVASTKRSANLIDAEANAGS